MHRPPGHNTLLAVMAVIMALAGWALILSVRRALPSRHMYNLEADCLLMGEDAAWKVPPHSDIHHTPFAHNLWDCGDGNIIRTPKP